MSVTVPSSPSPGPFFLLAGLAGLAALLIHALPLCFPVLLQDDFQILTASQTWPGTVTSLGEPHNEHVMPPGRLVAFVLVQLAGRASVLPQLAGRMGPAALLVGMVLVYQFVRGEAQSSFHGMIAAILFGVTSVYQQAVFWFSAAFALLALDTLLLALIACQRWRQTGRVLYLDLAVFACALAPGWFASGVLAGPLCCLYLLLRDPAEGNTPSRLPGSFSVLPAFGTALFLAFSLPRAADKIQHLEHYGGRTAAESFRPLTGLIFAGRSVVDNLLLGVCGVSTVEVPVPGVVVVMVLTAGLAFWWWRSAPHRRLLALGLGLILTSYWLIYSARALWGYEGVMTRPGWSRYHLLPQFGLALFVAGGLPHSAPWVEGTGRQVRILACLLAGCFLTQLPRGLLGSVPPRLYEEQTRLLRRVDAMDERCRRHHVSAALAREVLPPLSLEELGSQVNGWELLRGSDTPVPLTPEQARGVLLEE